MGEVISLESRKGSQSSTMVVLRSISDWQPDKLCRFCGCRADKEAHFRNFSFPCCGRPKCRKKVAKQIEEAAERREKMPRWD